MKLHIGVVALLAATVSAGKSKTTSKKASATSSQVTSVATGPVTIANTASAISSVLKAFSSLHATSTTSPTTTTKAHSTLIVTTKSKTTVKSKTTARAKTTTKAKTTAKAKAKAKSTAQAKAKAKAKTTTKAKLHARGASTITPSGNCGIGSPVTATNDCVNGWSCSSQNANNYQCVSATSSSPPASSSTSNVVTTTRSTAVPTTTIQDVNSPCATQPAGQYKYVPTDSSAPGFLADKVLYSAALAETAPSGYDWSFAGFYASVNQAGYMGYTDLTGYNASQCSAVCDQWTGCKGFVVYFERNPTLYPAVGCSDPSMQTMVRCALYSQAVDSKYASNIGQWRSDFAVVISGSNGYNKKAVTVSSSTTTTTTTSKATTTTAAATTTAANPFTILSAYFADKDVTSLVKTSFLTGGQLVINTTYPSDTLGADPWSANSQKVISVLYQYGSETRVFSAIQNSGVYKQQAVAYSASTAPGSTLVAAVTPPSSAKISITAVVFGTQQVTSSGVYTKLYSNAASAAAFGIDYNLFESDPNWGVQKTATIWYKNASGQLASIAGKEGAYVQFS